MNFDMDPDKMSERELRMEVKSLHELLRMQDTPCNIVFQYDDEEVGRFWFDENTRRWNFKGDKEKSATEFVAWVLVAFNKHARLKDND